MRQRRKEYKSKWVTKDIFFVLPISVYIRDQSITRPLIAIILSCDDWLYVYICVRRVRVYYTRNPIRILIGILAKIPCNTQNNSIDGRGEYFRKAPPSSRPSSIIQIIAVLTKKVYQQTGPFFFPRVCAPSWNRSTVGDKILRARFETRHIDGTHIIYIYITRTYLYLRYV